MDFSIGIAAYNEEANIGLLLDNLLNQSTPRNLCLKEIIVVSSGCTDRTEEIVKEYVKRHSQVKLINEKKRMGKTSAINKFFNNINCNKLVLVAADNLPSNGSIRQLLKKFNDKKVGAVGGRPVPINDPNTPWGCMAQLIWSLHHEFCISGSVKLSAEFCAISTDLVREIPENCLNDDVYIEWLTRRQGYKVSYADDAISIMKGPTNIHEFINQRRRIALGHLQIFDETKKRFIPPTYDFVQIFPIMLRVIRLRPKGLLWVIIAIVLEAFCHILARFDKLRGKVPKMWVRLPSTKKLR
ncbi:glycosyltransferase [[Eubacterium] cellulosolvens]